MKGQHRVTGDSKRGRQLNSKVIGNTTFHKDKGVESKLGWKFVEVVNANGHKSVQKVRA
jgi:hypothetical protein